MVYQAGQWKWHLFESFLPRDILFRIVVIKPPSFSTIADSIGWCGNRDRRFTIKFAYSLISNAEISPPNPIWKVGNIIEKACFMVGNTVLLSTSHCFSQLDTGVQHATVGGLEAIHVLRKDFRGFHFLKIHLDELQGRDWRVRIQHVKRDRNAVADTLAKNASIVNLETSFYASPPHWINGFFF
ncbi:hypothetical protein V6N12_046398 [Hibiscus sabdariffa]|uniref:RNase H type-1 domain-containing protein n=1 Tax=Hibiscus sabdariffa TaxID=183260 RepID=A0ABR2DII5_9ROSI